MAFAHVVAFAFEFLEPLEFRGLVDVPNLDFPFVRRADVISKIGLNVKGGRKSNKNAAMRE